MGSMIGSLWFLYGPRYASTIVYMLQSTEYQAGPYLKWLWRTKDFSHVSQRRTLVRTKAARLLLLGLVLGMLLQALIGLLLIILGVWYGLAGGVAFGLAIIIAYPFVWSHLVVVPLLFGKWLIVAPKERRLVADSEAIFASHPGIKIAVAGSYGKTTMKELLATVLSEGKKVAATPANKNVAVSHAQFAQKLQGNEDMLIIEYGEGAPGDVARFSAITHPTHAIITGLAPAHLDHYPTLEAAGQDIFAVADYLQGKNVYVNDESQAIKSFIKNSYHVFNNLGALGWKVKDVKVSLQGLKFKLQKGKQSLELESGLVGRHQIAVLALVAALGLELGLSAEQIRRGIAKTVSFEHRMQPYQLGGAWVIDDTYNGNIEGIRAGTELIKELPAKRKIYVTPGLVDQGEEIAKVHVEMGKLIAEAQPDLVVLMRNSVTQYIQTGLKESGFQGELRLETDPLNFYANLEHFVAAGDLVLMQNDWTDNYA
ncbi:MAG TPA: Mur ligase family protein [Candidatus Saccharimonadales bacterium]|nr:Mur ligase family protein [Candidatus Saccharimonadales bacterium]